MLKNNKPKLEQRSFECTMKHWNPCDTLKNNLVTAPLLWYLDFTKEFILEIDALLKGLGAVLAQQGNNSKLFESSHIQAGL